MSILQNFFNARRMTAKPAAGAAGAAAPSAPSYAAPDPAAQFDKLIADYHSNYKALGARRHHICFNFLPLSQNYPKHFSAETEHPKIIQEIADTEQVRATLISSSNSIISPHCSRQISKYITLIISCVCVCVCAGISSCV